MEGDLEQEARFFQRMAGGDAEQLPATIWSDISDHDMVLIHQILTGTRIMIALWEVPVTRHSDSVRTITQNNPLFQGLLPLVTVKLAVTSGFKVFIAQVV